MQTNNENSGIGAGINDFVQKYRKPIFVSAALILLCLIGFIAALSLMDMLRGRDIGAVEDFSSRYQTLQPIITEEFSSVDVEELLAELDAFAQKKSGYAGGRAWSIIGTIHGDKKDWAASEAAWAAAAKAAAKTYLAPVALFNAGAAAEEQEKTEAAIEYYSGCLSSAADFSAAPRAQFAIGRLRETLNENEAAIEAYRAVISGWSYDTVWTNLAQSRIIALETREELTDTANKPE